MISEALEKAHEKIHAEISRELGFTSLQIQQNERGKTVIVDGCHVVKDVEIDQYNNIHCKFEKNIPVEILKKIRRLFDEYLERVDIYKHRSGTCLYIRYFVIRGMFLTIDEIKELCDDGDINPEWERSTFREWLVKDSYIRGGNLLYWRADLDPSLFRKEQD